jgi:hypothetical protein
MVFSNRFSRFYKSNFTRNPSVEEFFYKELEGNYVIYKRFYYFYEFDNIKGNL